MPFFRRERPADAAAPSPPGSPLAPLPTPKVDRLNRNALSILAAFAGMGVIAMVVFIQPAPPSSAARTEAPPPQAGTYLDQPIRSVVSPGVEGAASGAAAAPSAHDLTGGRGNVEAGSAGAGLAPGYAQRPPSPEPYPHAGMLASGGAPAPRTPRLPTAAELRAAAYRRALDASPTGEESGGERPGGTRVAIAQRGITEGEGAPGVPAGGDAPASSAQATRAEEFMQAAARAGEQRTVQALTVQAAPGPFSVQAGTVIPAVLMTEINSDLPGECLAQITRDVYDTRAQRFLLIPRGSKLLCRYDDQLATGQSRLLVAWTRILLPDGRSVSLPGLPATDGAGARGVSDQVDRHATRAFGTAAALSLIGAAVQLSQPRSGSVFAPPSTGQIMAGALGQELNQVAVEMLRRDLTNRQTIRIRQGTEFNVFLNTDLAFPGPYATTRSDIGARAAAATDSLGRVAPVAGATGGPSRLR